MSGVIDCCGLVQYYLSRFLLMDEKIDEYEADKKIEVESAKWHPPIVDDALWGALTQRKYSINRQLQDSLNQFKKKGIESGTMIDLGCGNSSSAIDLLRKGWKVIAVDSSKKALENLQKRAIQMDANWIQTKQLTLICEKMESYRFPKDIEIVLADNSLSHCDPLKISDLFKSIHTSLRAGGCLIGNFYTLPGDREEELLFRSVFRAWFPDKALVEFLLENAGYRNEICAYDSCWSAPKCIEFVGRKV